MAGFLSAPGVPESERKRTRGKHRALLKFNYRRIAALSIDSVPPGALKNIIASLRPNKFIAGREMSCGTTDPVLSRPSTLASKPI